jgi:hypothetical protein
MSDGASGVGTHFVADGFAGKAPTVSSVKPAHGSAIGLVAAGAVVLVSFDAAGAAAALGETATTTAKTTPALTVDRIRARIADHP